MFCENCAKEIYDTLNMHEKMILYCIARRESAIAQLEEKLPTAKNGIIEATSFDTICGFMENVQSKAKCRQDVSFLHRVGILDRRKHDHSWTYLLSALGNNIVGMINEDEPTVQQILFAFKMKKGA